MEAKAIAHYVFVDFENVPTVDLSLVGDQPVHVTLFIGKNQKKLDVTLVQHALRLAPRVRLVEVGASGHNALDLTLAFYLGQLAHQNPAAAFFIVSKDKDFDPLVAHLKANGVDVTREDGFAALEFFPQPKKKSPLPGSFAEERLEKLIARLKNSAAPRPKKKSSLLARIASDFGNRLDEVELGQKVEELIVRGVVSIDARGKVSYL